MKTREQERAEVKQRRLEFEARVIELYRNGFITSDISKKLETYSGRVRRILRRNKLYRERTRKVCLNCDMVVLKSKNLYCNSACFQTYQNKLRRSRAVCSAKTMKKMLMELHGAKCMKCGWCEVHSVTKKVPVQINHIDGNFENNSALNLELLCPNCHSLTPNFGNLNKGNGREHRKRRNLLQNRNA